MSQNRNRGRISICDDLSFAASEAYKLLRTSLQYSFEGSHRCKVVGITSSVRNEGKSSLSINLAYMLSKDKKKVLLLEGDMRLPTVAKRLGLQPNPGLSEYLTGLIRNDEGIQVSQKAPLLSVITSGVIPPNPSELLGSESMKRMLTALKEVFDYIIVDLPPVNIVSDPLVLANSLDGFVFVVRGDYSTRQNVAEAMKKMEIVNARVLGFVFNSGKPGTKYTHDGQGYSPAARKSNSQ